MKKKFILFLGMGWCGTTSLYYTLKDEIKYMHGGWKKESFVLTLIFPPKNKIQFISEMERFKNLFSSMNHINTKIDPILSKFSEKELNSFFGPNISLKKYVEYYVKLAEYCGEDYTAVGDFSNTNWFLDKDNLNELRTSLSKYFDVKVLMIFRDPIRKQWSQTCAHTNGLFFSPRFEDNSNVMENFKKSKCQKYANIVRDSYDVFGKENVCYLIMEEFFKNEQNNPEVSKLEQFLSIKIPEVYPCVFVPDLGINPIQIDGLKDQWISDHQILTSEFYNEMRIREDYIDTYNEFKKLHGFLPADWGRPIDYGY